MKVTSLGKFRALQQCSTPAGSFAILAADHRGNLLEALQKHADAPITDADFTAFKGKIIDAMAVAGSAVLLDPEYSAAQLIASSTISGQRGLLVGVEKTGYSGDPTARENSLLPDWSVAKAKRAGVSGIKLLVHYHPDSATAPQIESLVQQVIDDCATSEIPLYLEPLSYSPDPAKKSLSSAERSTVVIEGAKRFSAMGIDVLKAEFPVDVTTETDERVWEQACADLSTACTVPWILLSGATSYETYLKQVTAACRNGASGVAVGRAIWQEAIPMSGDERGHFLRTVALQRMQRITALCEALSRPWTDFYQVGELTTTWYINY